MDHVTMQLEVTLLSLYQPSQTSRSCNEQFFIFGAELHSTVQVLQGHLATNEWDQVEKTLTIKHLNVS